MILIVHLKNQKFMHEIYDGTIALEDEKEQVAEWLKKDLEPQEDILGIRIKDLLIKKLKISLQKQTLAKTKANESARGTVTLPGEKNGARGVQSSVSIASEISHNILKEDPKEIEQIFQQLQNMHKKASKAQATFIADEINAGNIPFSKDGNVEMDHKKQVRSLLERLYSSISKKDAGFDNIDITELKVNINFEALTETEMKIWEVFFDHKEEGSDKGHRVDPLILDLNRDGKFDITGANQEGDGRVDGDTVSFDIDPSKQSWRTNSPGHRPGWYEGRKSTLVAAIPNGRAVYNTGKTENFGKKGVWKDDSNLGQSAKIYDDASKWIGEWVAADWGRSHGGRLGRYYFSPIKTNEQTEWMKPGSGDGFLVWDKNGDGIINDNTEMMSEFDKDGNKKFQNGFEKLAFYFDKDKNGVIEGDELSQLKVWVDFDGDAVTDAGELVPLSEHGITEIVIPGHGKMESTTKSKDWNKATMEYVAKKDLSFSSDDFGASMELGFLPADKVEEAPKGKLPLAEPAMQVEQYPEGSWQFTITEAQKIFKQKVIIRGTDHGGSYEGKAGTSFKLQSDKPWQMFIQHDDGQGGPWEYSKLQAESGGPKEHTLRSENWTDASFNDLTVEIKGVPADGSMDQNIAANETATFWGDPHFIGADGGKFDVQGEPNKTFNILTDKGLQFHGLFIPGDPPGVTLVGQTSLRLSKDGKANAIQFEPRKDIAQIDGQAITAKGTQTADGGEVHMKGKDVVATTAEGYVITQKYQKGGGPWPSYINADIKSGAKGVSRDGQMPTGILGQTFDGDSAKRDGQKGKGAQGQGAIDGVYTDYMIEDLYAKGYDEWFYLATYADVLAAVNSGEFKSGDLHYKQHGMSEGRHFEYTGSSEDFDEVFYLMTYVDVAMAISKGEFKSGAEHFVKVGSKRGYAPNPSGGGTFPEGALAEAFAKQQKPGGHIEKPEETPKNAADAILPVPAAKPNREIKWAGSISIESTAKYDVHAPSEKPVIDEAFNKGHLAIQGEEAIRIAKAIKNNEYDVLDGEADIDEDDVSDNIEQALDAKAPELRVDIFNFELDEFNTKISKQIEYTTQFSDKMSDAITSPNLPAELQKVQAKMEIDTTIKHGILDFEKEDELAARVAKTHRVANVLTMESIVQGFVDGKYPVSAKGANIPEVEVLKEVVNRTYAKSSSSEIQMNSADMSSFKVDISFEKLTESEMKIWEVFFDHKVEGSNKAHRIDPLILDLNRDGKFDITGANQEGNGKIDGDTVSFDIDPSKQSWGKSSPGHRPGWYEGGKSNLVPALPSGRAVYNTGKTENFGPRGVWKDNPALGQSAKIYDANSKWVGEWVAGAWGQSHGGRLGQYYFSPVKSKEQTEWMKPGSGDGFLVWDKNNDGIINDNTEMMSEFDKDGNKKFQNGFEKLAFYFDTDNNGVIKGAELNQLKVWVDIDGDAVTDKGELVPLAKHGITEIVIPGHGKMDSTSKTQTLEKFNVQSEGGATLSGYDFEPDRDLHEAQLELSKATIVEKTATVTVSPSNLPKELRNVVATVKLKTKVEHQIQDMSKRADILVDLGVKHGLASDRYLSLLKERLGTGALPMNQDGVKVDELTELKQITSFVYESVSMARATLSDATLEMLEFVLNFERLSESEMKIWEVFFDHKVEGESGGRRVDPLILDLNRDGKFDITGANQEGNGKIDGDTVQFDIDPSRQSWKTNSPGHRPGWYEGRKSNLVPALPNGRAIYNTGKTENFGAKGVWKDNPSLGQSAKIYDSNATWVGEWVAADWGKSHGGRLGRYYFSPIKAKESTEWMKPGSGDGFLVWDKNGNGIIDDNTEMMSEFDVNGNKKFQNGFEKLAFYFDKDDNGVVEGDELKQLKVWVDIDGDAVTDKGELVPVSKHGITQIVIPGHHKMESVTKMQDWEAGSVKTDSKKVSLKDGGSDKAIDGLPTQVIGADTEKFIDKGTSGVRIKSQARARIGIYENKNELMPTLDQLHSNAIAQVLDQKYHELISGQLPRTGATIDMQIGTTQQIATDVLTAKLWQSGFKANFDALRITLLEGWRPEELEFDKTGKAFEVFFDSEDAQVAKQNENKPPKVDTVEFSKTRPNPGDNISATIKGSDPENMALTWEWSWVGNNAAKSGAFEGNTLQLNNLNIPTSAKTGDKYGIELKLSDPLGAYVTHKQSLDAIQPLPPKITSASIPSRLPSHGYMSTKFTGTDPDGDDANLKWHMSGGKKGPIAGWASASQTGPNWNERRRIDNWHGRYSYIYFNISLTDEQGLTVSHRKNITVNPDPLVFDLNDDGKVEMTGAPKITNATYIPAGLWDIKPTSLPNDYRFVIADANTSNGVHDAGTSVNSAGRWGLAIETRNEKGEWESLKATAAFKETTGTISVDGVTISLNQTSDGGYVNDGKGVTSVGGEMVEFDINPQKTSWSKRSKTFRPGLGAPAAEGGKAVYDGGKTDAIGKTWNEDTGKGIQAKIYTRSGEWIGEWISGDPAEYFYGDRKDVEKTQWIAGNGDGFLVWDHNGDGIINDNTEMMSEFDKEGNAAFANGFEKLAYYFDKDKNGIIEGAELKGLMFWVDDGDAKTEAGELKELSEFGITQIMVPTDSNTLQGDFTKKDKETLTLSGGQYQDPLPDIQANPTDDIIPPPLNNIPGREHKIGGSVRIDSDAKYRIHHPGDKTEVDSNVNKRHQQLNDDKVSEIITGITDKTLKIEKNTVALDKKVIEKELRNDLVGYESELQIDILDFDLTLLKIDVNEQLRRTTIASANDFGSLDLKYAHPDLRNLKFRVAMETELKHHIIDENQEYDLFPQLLQFHQFFAAKQVKEIVEQMKDGTIPLSKQGAKIDETAQLKGLLDKIYSKFSPDAVGFANADLKKLDVDIKGEQREVSEVKALDAFFSTEDAQIAERKENKPPEVKTVQFSNTRPAPGQDISAVLTGSDPENMDLTWDWTWKGKGVETSGKATGDKLNLSKLSIAQNARTGDKYGIELKLSDPLGAYTTHKQNIDAVQPLPPKITSVQGASTVNQGGAFWLNTRATDPDGSDSNLHWEFSGETISNTEKSGPSGRAMVQNRASGRRSVQISVTDEQGLTAGTSHSYTSQRRRRRGDPLVFDLNQDNKIDLTGGEVAKNATSIPVGIWDIQVLKLPAKHRYVVSDANSSNGANISNTNVNSSGRWKIGIEKQIGSKWEALDITAALKDTEGTLRAGGVELKLTRTSDGGYEDDGMGFTSVGGEMVEFDMLPERSSWSLRSFTFRPGLGAPAAQGGRVEYDTGKKDTIGKTWNENSNKGQKAKVYTSDGEWIGEWVGGSKPEYFYGTRKDVEKTQWIAGNGDGFLVWDHNGDGIINDNTEMMSEFDKEGKHAFANGLEKLAHYFDKDKDGVVEANEMQGLMFWIDDGDAVTEAGELKAPHEVGITKIIVPSIHNKLATTSTKEEWKSFDTKTSTESEKVSLSANDYNPDRTVEAETDNEESQGVPYTTTAHDQISRTLPEGFRKGWEDISVSIKLKSTVEQRIVSENPSSIIAQLPKAHEHALSFYLDKFVHRIENEDIPLTDKGVKIDPVDEARRIVDITDWGISKQEFSQRNSRFDTFDIHFDYQTVEESEMKIWEVFFDHKDEGSDKGHRIDPLILDLNRDGKFDITGANQEGNGKIDGETVSFDIDPSKQSWKKNSPGHRPGYYEGKMSPHVDPVPDGRAVYNTGKSESTNKHGSGRWTEDVKKGVSAKIFDANGKWIGEWVARDWGQSHGGRLGRYYFSPTKSKEQTEWMKGTGDGLLVWDKNGNGIIDDNTEMMSEFDVNGNKQFQNGFEKLAHYFDLDQDGVIKGSELKGLKVWVDDGDGKTEEGELQSLAKHGITEIVIPGHGKMESTSKRIVKEDKDLDQSFGGTEFAQSVEKEEDPDALKLITNIQKVDAGSGKSSIKAESVAELSVFRPHGQTEGKFSKLHEFAIGNITQKLANALDAGQHNITDGVLDVNLAKAELDAQKNLRTMLWAEPELGVYKNLTLLSLIGKSSRTEVHTKRNQVAEALFTNDDAQVSKQNENKPPKVDSVQFSNKKPSPGEKISAEIKGSDPEEQALNWEWSWVGKGADQSGTDNGNDLNLQNLNIDSGASDKETYTIHLKLTDELGAYVTHKHSLDAIKPLQPPKITSASVPSRTSAHPHVKISAKGIDPDGSDKNLKWEVTSTKDGPVTGLKTATGKGPSFATNLQLHNRGRRPSQAYFNIVLTDEDGLSASQRKTMQMNPDPLIFDLNEDGKVDITGGEIAQKPTSLPSGIWNIDVLSAEKGTRYIINDSNSNNGAHDASNSTNASGTWKLGIEKKDGESWDAQSLSVNFDEKKGEAIILADGMRLKATRSNDFKYDEGDLSVNSVGGEMVEFDMDPSRSSWSDSSTSYRPGLGAPDLEGGKAEYDTGKTDAIGDKWRENTNKGLRAKLFDKSGEWLGEWVGGEPSTYYYGIRKDVEKTQWMAGNGDGLLVWDHNGNGIIDDNTEMMSEFDTKGDAAFANGFEKLAHYFDKDDNGIIEGAELKGLMFWVDDGDAITEAGELQTLQSHGIKQIILPQENVDFVGDYTQEVQEEIEEIGEAIRSPLPENDDVDVDEGAIDDGETEIPVKKITGSVKVSSDAKYSIDRTPAPQTSPLNNEIEKLETEAKKNPSFAEKILKKLKDLRKQAAPAAEKESVPSSKELQDSFHSRHQESNDAITNKIIARFISGEWNESKDADQNRDLIAKELETHLDNATKDLPLDIYHFELETLDVDIHDANDVDLEDEELSLTADIPEEKIIKLAKKLRKSTTFSEDFYLATYADVELAVRKSQFQNAKEHYIEFGKAEGRTFRYTDEPYDFDEVYYLTRYPEIAEAVMKGKYRSGAHHYWSVGRRKGYDKNYRNYDILKPISLEEQPLHDARTLPTESRTTDLGKFSLKFAGRGSSSVEAQVEGIFSGDLYPSSYLKMLKSANKLDQKARNAVKDKVEPLTGMRRDLEKEGAKTLKDNSLLSHFKALTAETADRIEDIAEELHKGQKAQKEIARQEEAEIDFLKEFQQRWKKRKNQTSKDSSMTKMELFKAVQEANKKLGQKKASPSLLKGLRDILDKDK